MAIFLTTKQIQDLLNVDRTTIYRMADSGKIPALKVGSQWRFPKAEVEIWLRTKSGAMSYSSEEATLKNGSDVQRLLPAECAQQIQDTFADALGVMVVVTDLNGNPLLEPSNPCGLFKIAEQSPNAHERCIESWATMANHPSMRPVLVESPLGLLCARALIRVGSELHAMLVVGGIAPTEWPPTDERVQLIAEYIEMDKSVVVQHLDEVFTLSSDEQQRLLPFVQRIADIMAHIITERKQLFEKLDSISELSRV